MGKVLKLGFAMGGGVSLGTYSGAALSEAIKLLILHGGYHEDEQFKEYEDIEIDVFSGASAGSMALAVMIRGLVYQTDEELKEAELQLRKELKEKSLDFDTLSSKKQKMLKVAQVVQNLQNEVWTFGPTIEKLLGIDDKGKKAYDLTFEHGLLRREVLEEIAAQYFDLRNARNPDSGDYDRKQILADRVLYCSTLSNIAGIVYDGLLNDEGKKVNELGLGDPYTSKGHKELRVFDLDFKKTTEKDIQNNLNIYPTRWVRCYNSPKVDNAFFSLHDASTWAEMVGASIACGAFPFAFRPVNLTRYKFEYGGHWPKELRDQKKSIFSYVDGGTFNNEPVKEAFRLASFLDAHDEREHFDRRIIFVDPFISEKKNDFSIAMYKDFFLESPSKTLKRLDGHDLERKTTLDRFLPHTAQLLSMIRNEAVVVETNKIFYTLKNFDRRKELGDMFQDLIQDAEVDNERIISIGKKIKTQLLEQVQKSLLPAQTLSLGSELKRKARELSLPKTLTPTLNNFAENFSLSGDETENKQLFKCLIELQIDLMVGLEGKSSLNQIICIVPAKLVPEKEGEPLFKETSILLPGKYMSGFAGFFSVKANQQAINVAKYTARQYLKAKNIIDPKIALEDLPEWKAVEHKEFLREIVGKLPLVKERVERLLVDSHLLNFGSSFDRFVLKKVYSFLDNAIDNIVKEIESMEEYQRSRFLFKIEVDDKRLEIDGRQIQNDIPARLLEDDKLYLLAELTYNFREKKWEEGIHVQDQHLQIGINGRFDINDRNLCRIKLPNGNINLKEISTLYPNPIIKLKQVVGRKIEVEIIEDDAWEVDAGVTPITEDIVRLQNTFP